MGAVQPVEFRNGGVLLLAGTTKGLFLLKSDPSRKRWQLSGPQFPGHAVYAAAADHRNGGTKLWAAAQSMHFGAVLHSSDDLGETWTEPDSPTLKFPAEAGVSLKQIWQITPGPADQPNTLYCGVEPAALFRSQDGGATWDLVRGLFDHPHRPRWQPGGGGMCLHTILPDPAGRGRIVVAISAAGVYRSDDGGRSWQARNHGVRAEFLPDKHPEFGQCVHKIVQHPSKPDRLFLQNHWGLYRSDDGGDSWKDVANGVPSDFGFAMAMHPHDAETVYILPLKSDEFRCVPEARLRVYRSRNAGDSWEPLTRGLPQKNAFETVLRDGMVADAAHPAGIYFGTRSGKIYGSADEGSSWQLLADGLPPVTCVKVALGEESPKARPRPRKSATPRKPKRSARGARA